MVNRLAESSTRFEENVPSKIENMVKPIPTEEVVYVQGKQSTYESDASLKEELSSDKAKKMTESINKLLETTSTKLRYEYHDKLEKYYVTLVDKQTDEVIQEIPNKKLMDMYVAMLDFVGIFVDKKI